MTDPILLAAAAIAFSAVAGCLAYRLARALHPSADAKSADLANLIVVRIGILHALIVALAFAEVKQNEMQARQLVSEEAFTVADTFYDFQRYQRDETAAEQRLIVRYAHEVIHRDWPVLEGRGALSEEAWATWRQLIDGTLNLAPADRRQRLIHDRLVRNVYLMEEQRQKRQISAHQTPHPFFWFTSISGLIIICACLTSYPPRRSTYVMIATFAGFTGAVLYLAYDVTTPFSGLSVIQPVGFEAFLRQPAPAAVLEQALGD
ncbi:MAG: hypothetical protein JWR10_993 [Rubritepida sp.]|nr:hypothetical protein [Rubritepida sp.]